MKHRIVVLPHQIIVDLETRRIAREGTSRVMNIGAIVRWDNWSGGNN